MTPCDHTDTVHDSHSRRTYCEGCGESWARKVETPIADLFRQEYVRPFLNAKFDALLERIELALDKIDATLAKHEARIGGMMEASAAGRMREDEQARWVGRSRRVPVGRERA